MDELLYILGEDGRVDAENYQFSRIRALFASRACRTAVMIGKLTHDSSGAIWQFGSIFFLVQVGLGGLEEGHFCSTLQIILNGAPDYRATIAKTEIFSFNRFHPLFRHSTQSDSNGPNNQEYATYGAALELPTWTSNTTSLNQS